MESHVIRYAELSDIPDLINVFESSIRLVARAHYSEAEIEEWLQTKNNITRWQNAIKEQDVLLAHVSNKVVGFGSLKEHCYIDFLYVDGHHQKRGIAQTILDALITNARKVGVSIITSDVSITARPFFERNGFKVVKQNHNKRGKEVLVNFTMQLDLPSA